MTFTGQQHDTAGGACVRQTCDRAIMRSPQVRNVIRPNSVRNNACVRRVQGTTRIRRQTDDTTAQTFLSPVKRCPCTPDAPAATSSPFRRRRSDRNSPALASARVSSARTTTTNARRMPPQSRCDSSVRFN